MAVILSNKYQSKNRDNFRKITGLSEANEKIKPENMPRIYGGVGVVYFEGQSAAGSSTGEGGDDTGIIDPNGSSSNAGGGNSGGGNSGGGDAGGGDAGDTGFNGECECVEVSTDGGCCISGKDCETGNPIKIQLTPSDDPVISCDAAPNPTTDPLGYVIIVYPYPRGDNCKNILLFPGGDIQGAFDAGVTAGGMCLVNIVNNSDCRNLSWKQTGDKVNVVQRQIGTPQGYVSYTEYRKFYKWECSNMTGTSSSSSASLRIETNPNSNNYKEAVNAYNKNKSKNYFIKHGKFYDVCDPYGQPPSSEPITMCDENGNQYEVSPDGKITKL